MGKKPIDLAAVRHAEQQLQDALAQYPELRERNPEREAALQAWLTTLAEEQDNALQTDRKAHRPAQDERV